MNILSEPLINYVILFSFLIFFSSESWENLDLQFILKKIAILNLSRIVQLVYMLFITAYNSLKYKFNFIKYKLISKCNNFLHCAFQLNKRLFFPIYFIIEVFL